jgi:hypothetical protein
VDRERETTEDECDQQDHNEEDHKKLVRRETIRTARAISVLPAYRR